MPALPTPAGTAPWLGWFGEVMVYSSALGSTDATNVIQYLKNKWAFKHA